MAGESTNKPQGSGSNPGRPPINDQGAAMPNPAPKPPSSLPSSTDVAKTAEAIEKMKAETEKALVSMEAFQKEQKEVNKTLSDHASALEAVRKAEDEYAQAMVDVKRGILEQEKSKKEIDENYKEFIDETTKKWKEGTEAQQKLYNAEMAAADAKLAEKKETEKATRAKALEKRAALEAAEKQRLLAQTTIEYLERLVGTVRAVDTNLADELAPSLQQITEANLIASEGFIAFENDLDKLPKSLKEVNAEIRLHELKENAAAEKKIFDERQEGLKKQAEQTAAFEKLKIEDSIKAQDSEILSALEASGGVAGASEMKKFLDEFVEMEKERLGKIAPDATEEQVAKRIALALQVKGKDFVGSKISERSQTDRLELEKRFIEKMMSEKSVDKKTAQQMIRDMRTDKSSEMYEELKSINERESEQLRSLKNLDDNQVQAIQRSDQERTDRLQREAEGAGKDPAKLFSNLGTRIASKLDSLKGAFSDIFGQNSGWLKKILLILTMVIGATIGYIWYKVQAITKILGFIPGFSKMFGGIGGFFSSAEAGISGFFNKLFGPIINFLRPILNLFPKITGTMGAFSRAFSVGFQVLGKFFFYITLAFDIIMGAVKGFQKLGNVEGILMGAVAGLVKFFTFGLVEFDDIFNFINDNLAPGFKMIGDTLTNAFNFVKDIFSTTIKSWSKAFKILGGNQEWGEKVRELVKIAGKQVASLIGMTGKFLINQIMILFGSIFSSTKGGSLTEKITHFVGDAFKTIWTTVTEGFISLFKYIKSGEFVADITRALAGGISEEEKKERMAEEGLDEQEMQAISEYTKRRGDEAYRQMVAEGNYQGAVEARDQAEKEAFELELERVSLSKKKARIDTAVTYTVGELKKPKPRTFFAGDVAAASADVSMAKLAASKAATTTAAINAPATTIVNGGGGESTVLMAPVSRNNDPTFRGFSMFESPSL